MSGFYIGIALLIISLNTKAQFSDNFTDNSLETNPVWVGEITKFSNTNGLLQLNGISESDEPRIFTASKAILNATWEGKIYLDVNPSSVNYAEIFLLATDTSASFSAYSLRFGGSADNISLIKTTSGNRSTKNASGASLFDKDSSSVHFRALLNADTLLVEIDTLGNGVFFPYLKELISLDISPQYFGVGCRHTATRKDKFRFDDFVVTGTQKSSGHYMQDTLKSIGAAFNTPPYYEPWCPCYCAAARRAPTPLSWKRRLCNGFLYYGRTRRPKLYFILARPEIP